MRSDKFAPHLIRYSLLEYVWKFGSFIATKTAQIWTHFLTNQIFFISHEWKNFAQFFTEICEFSFSTDISFLVLINNCAVLCRSIEINDLSIVLRGSRQLKYLYFFESIFSFLGLLRSSNVSFGLGNLVENLTFFWVFWKWLCNLSHSETAWCTGFSI